MNRVPTKQPVVAGDRFPKTRAVPRHPIVALAEVTEPMSRARVTGWTSTISDIGCHVLAATSSLKAGAIVQLEIEQRGEKFQTWARVASVQEGEGMGLAFFDTDAQQKETLQRWMEAFETSKAR